eukprot:CAMPEP_0113892194 /NCGR_PEP_ID=MMETSP0780_2-20120614/15260_1 /TAXON_ID=652834 /ORGANISM="Palpitomonas bilix" /LENGTH=790 /DNA_ID=CAMNT_0000882063 /DNA_START=21 /DNA_END=2393 /DNA_ORIENTATION=- /assembly_acc=CAM_ASM_000599
MTLLTSSLDFAVDQSPYDGIHVAIKVAILRDMHRLCSFFGATRTTTFVLPQVIGLLNQKNWEVKREFYHALVHISCFIKKKDVLDYVLPCVLDPFTKKGDDFDDLIAESALSALRTMCEVDMLPEDELLHIVDSIMEAREEVLRSSRWVIFGMVGYIYAVAQKLGTVDAHVKLLPRIRCILKGDIGRLTEDSLHRAIMDALLDQYGNAANMSAHVRSTAHRRQGPPSLVNVQGYLLDTGEPIPLPLPSTTLPAAELSARRPSASSRSYRHDDDFLFDELKMSSNAQHAPPHSLAHTHTQPPALHFPPIPDDLAPLDGLVRPSPRFPHFPAEGVSARSLRSMPHARGSGDGHYCPEGKLVTRLIGHNGAINQMAVSDDQSFLATASSDSTVKLWKPPAVGVSGPTSFSSPAGEVEGSGAGGGWTKEVATYASQKKRIRCLTTMALSATIASGSDDGSLHVFKYDRGSSCTSIREVNCKEGPVLAVDQYRTPLQRKEQNVVVYATQQGRIHGFDLRAKREAFVLTLDRSEGMVQTMTNGDYGNYLAMGTNRGVIQVWDTRFLMKVKSFETNLLAPVHRLVTVPGEDTRPFVFAATGLNEVSVWDIEKGRCVEAYRGVCKTRALHAEESEWMKQKEKFMQTDVKGGSSRIDAPLKRLHLSQDLEPSVRGLLVLRGVNGFASSMLTGGTDRHISLWNLAESSVFERPIEGADKVKPRILSGPASDKQSMVTTSMEGETKIVSQQIVASHHNDTSPSAPVKTEHFNAILDLAVANLGDSKMFFSAGRDSVVHVWH